MVTVSAPGKIILMGEHAVVYGKPALICAVNKRLTVTVDTSSALDIHASEGEEYIRHILNIVSSFYGFDHLPGMIVSVHSEIPIGYHLGSSAALAAALVGAVSFFLKKIWNPQQINQLAYKSEGFIHKNASGVDPAAVVSGGLIWYRKELEFLRSIWQFPFSVPRMFSHFQLIDTGRPRESTGEMVSLVAQSVTKDPHTMESLFSQNEVQVKRLTTAIKEENESSFIDALRLGESTLEKMGVVSRNVIPVIRAIEESGGAAKILGGGGKKEGVGFLLCYHHDPKKVETLCKPYGYTPRSIQLGEEGIRLEKRE